MKKLISIFAAIAMMFSIASCDELANLLTVTFEDVEIAQTLNVPLNGPETRTVSIAGDVEVKEFEIDTVINLGMATDNGKIDIDSLMDYLDDLKEVTIDTFTFTVDKNYKMESNGVVTSVALPDEFEITELEIKIAINTTDTLYSESFASIKPGQLIDTKLTEDDLSNISDALLENNDVYIYVSGKATSEAPNFNLITRIIADIKANPIAALDNNK